MSTPCSTPSSYPQFTQSPPVLSHPWHADPFLRQALLAIQKQAQTPPALWQQMQTQLQQLADDIVSHIDAHGQNCERFAPTLQQYDPWGNRVDRIHTHPSWRKQHAVAAQKGLIATGYERGEYGLMARVFQFAKLYLWSPSSGLYSCPLAMTDGATRLMELILDEHKNGKHTLSDVQLQEIQKAYSHFTSRNPCDFWTSGQYMTERAGGSDVGGGTQTIARLQSDGYYRLYGFKWFTSATDSDVTITLARIEDPATGKWTDGSKGLSCFFMRIRDSQGKLNNIEICRLKDKLGTRQLPTAELELQGSRAILISEPGRGVAFISSLINITRLYNTLVAAAGQRRVISLQRDYMHKRVVFGKTLSENSLHLETIADMEVHARASLLIALNGAFLLGKAEMGVASPSEQALLRLITPLAKLYTGKQAVNVASEGLESFGGNGYMEDTGLARLLRDAQVLPIWEGTTNVLAHDVLRVLKKDKGKSIEAMFTAIQHTQTQAKQIQSNFTPQQQQRIQSMMRTLTDSVAIVSNYLRHSLSNASASADLERLARDLAFALARLWMANLLVQHAVETQEWDDWVASERWLNTAYNAQTPSISAFIPLSLLLPAQQQGHTDKTDRAGEVAALARGPFPIPNQANNPPLPARL